jgi:hypothetical protein
MTAVDGLIDTFEGVKSRRIVWLPTITLGYIYTLSGYLGDFVLAVAAIGGARFITDLIRTEPFEDDDSMGERQDRVKSKMSTVSIMWVAILMVLYVCAIVWGLLQLHAYFTHTNLILVGLAGVYWGTLLIVITNLLGIRGGADGE